MPGICHQNTIGIDILIWMSSAQIRVRVERRPRVPVEKDCSGSGGTTGLCDNDCDAGNGPEEK